MSVHTGMEGCVRFKMQNHLFKLCVAFLATTQKEKYLEGERERDFERGY